MDLTERFGTDPESSENGKWIVVARNDDGTPKTELLIARANNARYREKFAAGIKSLGTNPSDAATADMLNKAMAHGILLGWRGEFTIDGNDIGDYSEKRAYELFCDPRLTDFKDFVLRQAQNVDNYRTEKMEEDQGN